MVINGHNQFTLSVIKGGVTQFEYGDYLTAGLNCGCAELREIGEEDLHMVHKNKISEVAYVTVIRSAHIYKPTKENKKNPKETQKTSHVFTNLS